MNPLNPHAEREEKAVAALIAAALHQEKTPVDSALVAKYLRGEFTLTEEDVRALAQAKLNLGAGAPVENTRAGAAELDVADNVAALHRQKPTSGFSKATEEELERRRRELREKLSRRKTPPP